MSLPITLAMNLPLPSGSSPDENPPQKARIWQLFDGAEHIVGAEVAEHEGADFGAGHAESLGGVVVAVGAGEYRHAYHGVLHGCARVNEV